MSYKFKVLPASYPISSYFKSTYVPEQKVFKKTLISRHKKYIEKKPETRKKAKVQLVRKLPEKHFFKLMKELNNVFFCSLFFSIFR